MWTGSAGSARSDGWQYNEGESKETTSTGIIAALVVVVDDDDNDNKHDDEHDDGDDDAMDISGEDGYERIGVQGEEGGEATIDVEDVGLHEPFIVLSEEQNDLEGRRGEGIPQFRQAFVSRIL